MADPLEPTPSPMPPPPGPAPEPIPPNPTPPPDNPLPRVENAGVTTNSTSTGLPSNVAAALACFPLIGGIIFYLLEKRDSFVRFYAMQSIIFGGAWLLFNFASAIAFGIFSFMGAPFVWMWHLISSVTHLALFIIMIIAMVKAFSGLRWDIPYIGPMARKHVGD